MFVELRFFSGTTLNLESLRITLSLEMLYLYSAHVFIPVGYFIWNQDYCYFLLC